jgi:hypothetical protein
MLSVGNDYELIPGKETMQAAVDVVHERKVSSSRRTFALCNSCFWSATLFSETGMACPACATDVSLIPLTMDEQYRLKVSPASGVEVSFSRAKAR